MPHYRCRAHRCRTYLNAPGYCAAHQTAINAGHNALRTFYRSADWKRLAQQAKDRDGHCQAPGCYSLTRLVVHHRRPRPRNAPGLTPADDLRNLVVLCQTCHNRLEADIRAGRQSRLRNDIGS